MWAMVKATGSCLAPDPATMLLISSLGVFVAGLLRSWWKLRKIVALPLMGYFDKSAKRADSDANSGAVNVIVRDAPGASMLVAGFQWVAEPIVN